MASGCTVDTTTIVTSLPSGKLAADLRVSAAAGQQLVVAGDGAYVPSSVLIAGGVAAAESAGPTNATSTGGVFIGPSLTYGTAVLAGPAHVLAIATCGSVDVLLNEANSLFGVPSLVVNVQGAGGSLAQERVMGGQGFQIGSPPIGVIHSGAMAAQAVAVFVAAGQALIISAQVDVFSVDPPNASANFHVDSIHWPSVSLSWYVFRA